MKKSKIFLVLALAMVIALSTALALVSLAADTVGMTFSATKYFDQEKNISPTGSLTFEAEIWMDPNKTDSSTPDIVYGNYVSSAYKGVDFLIRNDGSTKIAEIYLVKEDTKVTSVVFKPSNTSVKYYDGFTSDDLNILKYCTGTADAPGFCRVVISIDVTVGTANLYINGNKIAYITASGLKKATLFDNLANPFRIGGDFRSGNGKYFNGQIKSAALYNDVRTDAEIKADASQSSFAVDASDPDLLFAYDLTDTSVTGLLRDLSANKNNAINPNTYVPPAEPEEPKPEEVDNGFSFAQANRFDMEEPITPNGAMTFEAYLTLPTSTSAHNWIVGNWESWEVADKSLGIQFASNRVLEVFVCKGLKVNSRYKFTLPEPGENDPLYRKITLAFDMDGYITCYLDGVQLGDKVPISLGSSPETFYNQVRPFRLGGDYRSNNTSYLKGIKVKSIAMYKGLPTAGASVDGLEAMFKYDLTDTSIDGYFSDLSGKSNDAIDANAYDPSLKYDYSFAIVGDTQYMTRWDAIKENGVQSTTQHLKQVYDWLLANKDKKNIQYVMGLGDITDSLNKSYATHTADTATEWAIAYEQISRLNGNIPYSLVRGNHDNSAYLNQYFNELIYKSQFSDPDYSDNSVCFYSADDVANAYTKFTAGSEKYLLLLLDDKPTDAVVEWANEVIARNPDYRVIINTHTYLGYTGDLIDRNKPEWQYATTTSLAADRNDGQELWDSLVSKHENIVLVLCGHDYKTGGNIVRTVRVGENGNAVNEMLICPQSLDGDSQKEMKYGMVAMLYFSNDGKDIRVEYVSTAKTNAAEDGKDVYYKAEKNNIKINLMTPPVESRYGYIYPEYVDAAKYPFAVFSESGIFLGGFESLLDIVSPYNDGGAIYAAKAYLGSNAWENGSYGENPRSVVILVRSDYAMKNNESYDNISHIEGTVRIDLNGYTITASDAKSMFPVSVKAMSGATDFETRFEIVNGSVKLGAYPLISFSISSSADLSCKPYIHEFTNVEFIASASSMNLFVSYNNQYAANPEIIFNGCTIDLTNAPEGATVFNLGNGVINTDISVIGGEFIFGANSVNMLSKEDGTTSELRFDTADGIGYTTFTLPEGVALPEVSINGGKLAFIKLSENNGSVTYGLRPAELATLEFSPKVSVTLDRNLVMNIYIPTALLIDFAVDGGERTAAQNIDPDDIRIIDGEEFCLVKVELPSSEAARVVTLGVTVAAGDKSASGTFYLSIPKYAESVLKSADTLEAKLVCDVLSYIRAAYIYFGSEDDAAIGKIDDILGEGYDANNAPELNGSAEVPTAGLKGAALVLDSTPAIRFYITEDASAYEFFADGRKLETALGADVNGTYIEMDVYAYAMAKTITYTIDGQTSGSYHLNCYYSFVTADANHKNNVNLINLVERFAKYCESAAAYKATFG